MQTPSIVLSLSLLLSMSAFAGPKYQAATKPLSQDHAYFQETATTDYWKIAPFYVPQHNPKACSVASVAAVLSAIQAESELTSSDENFTSEKILKLSRAFDQAVGKTGKGMDLDTLEKSIRELLEQKWEGRYQVSAQRFDGKDQAAEKKKLVELLKKNESNPNDFVIVNFLQGVLTGDPEGRVGHISPIGAYDAKRDRALVMDVDRQYYEPYWVSTDDLLKAMNTIDATKKKARGLVYVGPATH